MSRWLLERYAVVSKFLARFAGDAECAARRAGSGACWKGDERSALRPLDTAPVEAVYVDRKIMASIFSRSLWQHSENPVNVCQWDYLT